MDNQNRTRDRVLLIIPVTYTCVRLKKNHQWLTVAPLLPVFKKFIVKIFTFIYFGKKLLKMQPA